MTITPDQNEQLKIKNEESAVKSAAELKDLQLQLGPDALKEVLKQKNIDFLVSVIKDFDNGITKDKDGKQIDIKIIQEALAKRLLDEPLKISYVKKELNFETYRDLLAEVVLPDPVKEKLSEKIKKEKNKSNDKNYYYNAAVSVISKELGKDVNKIKDVLKDLYGESITQVNEAIKTIITKIYPDIKDAEKKGSDALAAAQKVGGEYGDIAMKKGLPALGSKMLLDASQGRITPAQADKRALLVTTVGAIFAGFKALKWLFSKDATGGFFTHVGMLIAGDLAYNVTTGKHLTDLLKGVVSGGMDDSYIPFADKLGIASPRNTSNQRTTEAGKQAEQSDANMLIYMDVNFNESIFGEYKISELSKEGVLYVDKIVDKTGKLNISLNVSYDKAIEFLKKDKNKNKSLLLEALVKGGNEKKNVEKFMLNGFAKIGITKDNVGYLGETVTQRSEDIKIKIAEYQAKQKEIISKSKKYRDILNLENPKRLTNDETIYNKLKASIKLNKVSLEQSIKEFEKSGDESQLQKKFKEILGDSYEYLTRYYPDVFSGVQPSASSQNPEGETRQSAPKPRPTNPLAGLPDLS